MKIKTGQLNDYILKASKSVYAYLFYGSDLGAVRDNANQIIAALKKKDANLEVDVLTADLLKENPARLKEDAASESLFASKRVLWLKNPPDNLLNELDDYLTNASPDTPVLIITSDAFNTKSKTVNLIK